MRPAQPKVLVLTHTADTYVPDQVIDAVHAEGGRGIRVDTDTYPHALELVLQLDTHGPRAILGGVPDTDVAGVYLRRLGRPQLPGQPEVVKEMVAGEARLHWAALTDVLTEVRWVNPPTAAHRVEGHKLHQLRRAAAAGLRVPPTLVTSDPDAARAFAAAHDHDIVAKLLGALSASVDGTGPHVPTTPLTADDHAALEGLRTGPMCLQPRLRGRRELRVAWVDGQSFVGALDTDPDQVDWRRRPGRWAPHRLDAATEAAVGRLMRDLGLTMGALDLLLPDDGGAPWFLEVNPAGEWGMLQAHLGLPVAQAIARYLMGGTR